MDFEEPMVDVDEIAEDDTSLDDFVEEEDESEEEDFSEEFPDEEEEEEVEEADEEEVEDEEEEEEEPPASEPGWMKKRIGKAVEKAVRETEARMQAMFEEQMKPFREKMIEDEAQALVASRKVADLETARELVRYRQGAQPDVEEEQPRNEHGQFASREQIAEEARINARIDMLTEQRNKILKKTGFDVMDVFNSDPEIKRQVVDGEIDFYEVADMQPKKKRPPTPSRSPNGSTNMTPNAFATMSSKQFARLEKKLDEGVRYKMR